MKILAQCCRTKASLEKKTNLTLYFHVKNMTCDKHNESDTSWKWMTTLFHTKTKQQRYKMRNFVPF